MSAGMSEAEGQPVNLGGHQQAVTAMACGARHTCAVSHMGQLFCWGWSLHGQCGQGRAVVSVPQPQAVPGTQLARQIDRYIEEMLSLLYQAAVFCIASVHKSMMSDMA